MQPPCARPTPARRHTLTSTHESCSIVTRTLRPSPCVSTPLVRSYAATSNAAAHAAASRGLS
jgi:hypothetical protein